MYPVICLMHRLVTTSLWNTEDIVAGAFVPHFSIPRNEMTKFVSLAGTAMKSICISSTLPNYYIRKVDVHLVHLLFHILRH